MQPIAIDRRPASAGPDLREVFERMERVQRRLEAMAQAEERSQGELRRQRAAGRRP